ncbi:putative acyl-CoA oxidase [Tilletiaria anomala UBC 951]|uniref:Acyl-coenzyme A oxidase n=1 Tax=Tilletiaria anomala (strain ATCC 24038 / CBS 436.72 / UBC 951) TaxID=1037660 RepID=A0A066VRK0_TILAU|nr:putative acyl-CoA oxidase [Tilletiaria anomala UBC 951]KDN42878.1 putative acyl-CoA oxidase [Tilletiaria anomala UBC 951]
MAPPINVAIPAHLTPAGISGNKLLGYERAKASFDSQDMAEYIHGKAYLEEQTYLLNVLANDPAFDKSSMHYLGRTERFRAAMKKDKRLAQLQREHNWSDKTSRHADFLCDSPAPFGLHKSMFITTLRNMGTDEQREAFLKPAEAYQIIGCYAQTELGHGSNVQGLETTCTYEEETKEFIVHSPTLTSAKWWIGGLGRSADHAIVMAQLILKGKSYGPHPIIVQIRDIKTREPLPGRIIADIGPKAGYNTTDNGTLLLDQVRVPHMNLLARFAKVDPDTAAYVPPKNSALTYGTLTWVRANIVQDARTVLMRATTIAIRYCAIRRQFGDRDAPKFDEHGRPVETQVLDYTMVQYRLLPILAQAFAFHYTAKFMYNLYHANEDNVQSGDLSLLADTHASSSGLKSLVTLTAASAIEECRRACGGHGYSMSSGLPSFYADYLPNVTWEGDSYMLTQQCTRYLFKMMRQLKTNPATAEKNVTTEYMARYLAKKDDRADIKYIGDLYSPVFFIKSFAHRAAYLVEQTLQLRDNARRSWNSLLVEMYRCSKAHSQFLVVRNFSLAILNDDELNRKPALRQIMQRLYLLFCCYTMEQEAADFLTSGFIDGRQAHIVSNKVQELLAEVRPQAVPLVDAFALPDFLLNSSLGRADGMAYEALFDFAVREPINSTRWDVNIDDLDAADMDEIPRASKL